LTLITGRVILPAPKGAPHGLEIARRRPRGQAGGCWDRLKKEMKFPKYEKWPGYQAGLPMVLRRYCGLWGRGT
jgi:hypothetical protein